jgi:hypothetical protein
MQPEVITAFPEKRWARATKTQYGVHLAYGIGRLCASYVLFPDAVEALFAHVNWEEHGIEPRRTGTLTSWPAVTDQQLEAAAEQLEACR